MKYPKWATQPRLNNKTVVLTSKGWKVSQTGELLVSCKQVLARIKAYLKATTVAVSGTQLQLNFSGTAVNLNFNAITTFLNNPSVNLPVTSIVMLPATATIAVAGTQQLTSTVAPDSAWNKALTYTSSAPAVATVSATGLVTGVTSGTATITVRSVSNNAVTDTTVITVS
ncbi:Bacterial Ig-like domain (group 2) [compost metagenome]